MRSYIYSTQHDLNYDAEFREVMTWDRSRSSVLFKNKDGQDGSARRPAYFYLKGAKGAIVIATLHNSSTSPMVRKKQLEHVDWLLPGKPVDKSKVLFALMGDFNQKIDRPGFWSTKSFWSTNSKKIVYLKNFWVGCDKVGLKRCSDDTLKTAVKNGEHYDDIFVTGDFDRKLGAACYPTYSQIQSWGTWEQVMPAELKQESDFEKWARFTSKVLSDHLLVYADVSPPRPLGFWGQFVNVVNVAVRVETAKRGFLAGVDAARLLLEKGAAVARRLVEDEHALFAACYGGHVDKARLLLNNGADVDRAMKNGQTPLYTACCHGHYFAARLLLNNGAAVDRAMKNGQTPLFIAKMKGHSSIVALLEARGASEPARSLTAR